MISFKDFLSEKAPPDPRVETWIKKNKQRFIDQYGEKKGKEILYGHAWNLHKKWESEK